MDYKFKNQYFYAYTVEKKNFDTLHRKIFFSNNRLENRNFNFSIIEIGETLFAWPYGIFRKFKFS